MSQDARSPSTHALPAADDPPSPTPPASTKHEENAAKILAHFAAIRALMPPPVPLTPEVAAFLRRKKKIPRGFVTSSSGSIPLMPDLESVPQLDAAGSADDADYLDAMRSPQVDLTMLKVQFDLSIDLAEGRQTTRAQKFYAMMRGLALDPNDASITAHVAVLKKARSSGSRRPKKQDGGTPPVTPAEAKGGAAQT
jgi:hypothetical protein